MCTVRRGSTMASAWHRRARPRRWTARDWPGGRPPRPAVTTAGPRHRLAPGPGGGGKASASSVATTSDPAGRKWSPGTSRASPPTASAPRARSSRSRGPCPHPDQPEIAHASAAPQAPAPGGPLRSPAGEPAGHASRRGCRRRTTARPRPSLLFYSYLLATTLLSTRTLSDTRLTSTDDPMAQSAGLGGVLSSPTCRPSAACPPGEWRLKVTAS